MIALVHHSEITLKGKNTGFYSAKLMTNIRRAFSRNNIEVVVKKDSRRLVCNVKEKEKKTGEVLKTVLGVKNYSFPHTVEKDISKILKKVETIIKKFSKQGVKTLSIETKRADKRFKPNSLEINKQIGKIANDHGIKINYSEGEKTIFIEITYKKCYIYTEKSEAHGGLPVSTTGKVLCLFSGGIDSAVASWLMMRRGCRVDFLHFHTFRDNRKVMDSKIKNLVEILNNYQFRAKLYAVPYHKYQLKSLKAKQHFDLVLFRNFMLRYAAKLAKKYDYKAIVTGDSLAQVASQTLLNLGSAAYDVDYLTLRPLLAYTKEDIIEVARKIGTYEESIKKYKDCCSIISSKPNLNVKIADIKSALSDIDMREIINESLNAMERFKIQ